MVEACRRVQGIHRRRAVDGPLQTAQGRRGGRGKLQTRCRWMRRGLQMAFSFVGASGVAFLQPMDPPAPASHTLPSPWPVRRAQYWWQRQESRGRASDRPSPIAHRPSCRPGSDASGCKGVRLRTEPLPPRGGPRSAAAVERQRKRPGLACRV